MKFPIQIHTRAAPHASAWWIWAGLMVAATSRSTNIFELVTLGMIAILIAHKHRISQQQWKTFVSLMIFAIYLVIARIALQIVFGAPFGSDVLFRLPSLELPSWFTGVRIGGVVTLQSIQSALMHGLGLAVTVAFIAAASSVTSIPRLLRQLPASFQSFATLIIIAVTFIPTVFADVQRLKKTHRWRGISGSWIRRLHYNVVALGDGALRRSVMLTSSMVTRGYELETANSAFLVIALTCGAVGIGLWTSLPGSSILAFILFVAAAILLVLHMRISHVNAQRTRLQNDTWAAPDYVLIGSAAIALFLMGIFPLASVLLALFPLAVVPAAETRVNA